MRLEGFARGTYQSQALIAAGERCVNQYPEVLTRGNKAQAGLFPIHGPVDFATLHDAPGRGIIFEQGRAFAVAGKTLQEVFADGSGTVIGEVGTDANPVTMWTNGPGQELFVVSDNAGHIYDLGTGVLTTDVVTDVRHGGHLDGFFLRLDPATSTLGISEFSDGLTWDPTQVVQRQSSSDDWQAMIVAGQEIFLIGDKTGDVFFNAGLSPFPFAPRTEAFFEVGIAAPFSLALFGQAIAWLGQTAHGHAGVYRMLGYQPQKISTPGLDWLIQQYAEGAGIADAIGWSYARDGHEFYVLAFPAAAKTWGYDATTQEWHERAYWDATNGVWLGYRPIFHAHAFEQNLVCDSEGSGVYRLSSTTFTDVGGSALRRIRVMPHVAAENRIIRFPYAELEAQRGVGTGIAGQGLDPVVELRHSDDGGHTWSGARARRLGKIGEFSTRMRWLRCGAARDRVWELSQTDPVASRWLDFYFDAK